MLCLERSFCRWLESIWMLTKILHLILSSSLQYPLLEATRLSVFVGFGFLPIFLRKYGTLVSESLGFSAFTRKIIFHRLFCCGSFVLSGRCKLSFSIYSDSGYCSYNVKFDKLSLHWFPVGLWIGSHLAGSLRILLLSAFFVAVIMDKYSNITNFSQTIFSFDRVSGAAFSATIGRTRFNWIWTREFTKKFLPPYTLKLLLLSRCF